MPRLIYSLAALAVLAAGSLPLRTSGADVALGDLCGNADTCVDNNLCVLNRCITKESLGDSGAINGETNKCSADDCCASESLVCWELPGQVSACFQIASDVGDVVFTEIPCRGQPRSFNDTNAASGSGGVLPNPDSVTDIGKDCDEATCCAGNLVCLAGTKKCAASGLGLDTLQCGATPSDPNTVGLGQTCSATTCCSDDFVCYDQSKVCGPKIPGFANVECGTGTIDGTDTTVPPTSCSVAAPCTAGQTCLGNYCVADNLVPGGTLWGLGNSCSADVCCPNGYVCLINAGSRCGPQITTALGVVGCTASGAATSGQTITSDGAIPEITPIANNPDQGSAASTIAIGAGHVAIVAAAAVLMALFA